MPKNSKREKKAKQLHLQDVYPFFFYHFRASKVNLKVFYYNAIIYLNFVQFCHQINVSKLNKNTSP